MKRTIILCFSLVVAALCVADDTSSLARQTCVELLTAAEQSLATPDSADYARLYEQAFKTCDLAELSIEDASRYFNGRADYLQIVEKDVPAAVKAYEEGLEWMDAQAGIDHPARIRLLDGLANALDVLVLQGLTKDPATTRQQVGELLRESLEIRQTAYGEASPQAIEGWCLLSMAELDESPGLAEERARKAVKMAESLDDRETLLMSLTCLKVALKEQGKAQEAEQVMDRYLILANQARQNEAGSDRPRSP